MKASTDEMQTLEEKAEEKGAREMVQIVVQFWTKHECDEDAPILSTGQVEERCIELWKAKKRKV